MAHSAQAGQRLAGLDLLKLRDEPLDSLEQRLRETAKSSITGTHIIFTYIVWLGEQLRDLDPSDSASLRTLMTSWCTSLRVHGVNTPFVLFSFLQWKREQLSHEPTHAGIFTLAGLEIQKEFRGPGLSHSDEAGNATLSTQGNHPVTLAGPESDNQPGSRNQPGSSNQPESDNPLGQIHPSRIPNLEPEPSTPPVIEWHNWAGPMVALSSDISEQAQDTLPSNATKKPSFLTGANEISPSNSKTSIAALADNKYKPRMTKKQRRNARKKEKTVSAQGHQQARITTTPDRMIPKHLKPSPPRINIRSHQSNDICGRCGMKGHLTRRCPTNLDVSFDVTPPAGFQCHICEAKGSHFPDVCPRNSAKRSLTQQRKRALAVTETDRERERNQGRVNAPSPQSSRRGSRGGSHMSPDWRFSRRGFSGGRSQSPAPSREVQRGRELRSQGGLEPYGRSPNRRESRSRPRKANEGRLSYWDDDSDQAEVDKMVHEESEEAWEKRLLQRAEEEELSKAMARDEAIALAEADAFLDNFADELFGNSPGVTLNQYPGSSMEIDSQAATEAPPPTFSEGQARPISPPIELGKTIKGLERYPPYSDEVHKLFRHRENAWVNKAARRTALEMWDETDQKKAEKMKEESMDPPSA